VRYFIDSITSRAYWQYVLFSVSGTRAVVTAFGAVYLVVESLDFFDVYTRSQYGDWAFPLLLLVSVGLAVGFRRPVRVINLTLPQRDVQVEVRIDDLFGFEGATMISTNTAFESDVAGGRIAPNSLQGQFTAKYFTGNQNELIGQLEAQLDQINDERPYPMGTTVEINTHGKTFYFTAMATLNAQGNAQSSLADISAALAGLWTFIRNEGELQEIGVPVIGTGRGRLRTSRKKIIGRIAESFVKASEHGKVSDKLVIFVHPDDAKKFQVNLHDVKDYLVQLLES
jgi:hypothetical protein